MNADEPLIVRDATCLGCGCLCDDLDLRVAGDRIVAAERACELGRAWFCEPIDEALPACRIDGKPVDVEQGIERAAQVLVAARNPLVYGLSDAACQTQGMAAAIADWSGANLDTRTSDGEGATLLALQSVGQVTSSLGEVRHRGDLILFWGTDPAANMPRHFERYSLHPPGMFLPDGRAERTCIVIDVRATATSAAADEFIQIRPGSDFEGAWTLRALAADVPLDADAVQAATGVSLATWRRVMERMQGAKFGVLFYGSGTTTTRGRDANAEALLSLVRDMNRHTRFVALAHRGGGNRAGADNVLAWRTGFPFAVNFGRGYPRYGPGEFTAEALLSRREADAALIVGADPLAELSAAARDHLAKIPSIVVDHRETASSRQGTVAFAVAKCGVQTGGTVYRFDDVPIPLRPAFPSTRPSDYDVLSGIERRVREMAGQQAPAAAAR